MKIRRDFITNSSSSSFVLGFKDENEYQEMYDALISYDYEPIAKLIQSLADKGQTQSKAEAVEYIYNKYRAEAVDERMKTFTKLDNESNDEYWKRRAGFALSDEFNQEIDEAVKSNFEYQKEMQTLNDSGFVVSGMIWDTEGGLAEWAIRNSFLRDTFTTRKFLISQFDVG